jgi:hypothetical protein
VQSVLEKALNEEKEREREREREREMREEETAKPPLKG